MRLEYFQLIDRVVDLDLAGLTIRCEATVPTTSTIFEGHFPGYPLMPGVLLIETMAQTSGWLVVAANRFERMPFLAAVKDAKLRTFVTPGQILSVKGTLTHEGSGYTMAEAGIAIDGKTVCDAKLTFSLIAFPNAEMHRRMRETAAAIGLASGAPADG
jgi:3-hydroxyacyl-[acyl-carrier-protein] dehydratase